MRRTIGFLLCVMLLACSARVLAEQPTLTVSELRRQTEFGWHQTYEAHGRTIAVDIPLITPDVTELPILSVGFMPTLSDEAVTPLKEGMEFLMWDTDWTHKEGKWYNGTLRNEEGELWYMPVSDVQSVKNKADNVTNFTMTPLPLAAADLDTAYLDGSELTLRQADTLYQEWMTKLYPNQSFEMRISSIELQSAVTHKKKVIVSQGAYWLTYQQVLEGIPVISRIINAFNQSSERIPALEEYIQTGGGGDCSITTQKDFSVRYCLYNTESVLHEDVPLCSFEPIRLQLEQLIADGTLREVRSAELGYVAWPNPDNPKTFVLLPMWVVHVRLMDSSTRELPSAVRNDPVAADECYTYHLFFNAQTGEWTDRLRTDDERCAPPKIITW